MIGVYILLIVIVFLLLLILIRQNLNMKSRKNPQFTIQVKQLLEHTMNGKTTSRGKLSIEWEF